MKKFFALAAIFAATMISFTACEEDKPVGPGPDETPTDVCEECGKNPCECEEDYVSPITIDGDFADWAGLDASKVSVATCNADAKWTALKTVKVYCDDVYLNVYFEFDADEIADLSSVPFHVYINEDASAATGNDQFLGQGGQDWLMEGFVFSEGAFCSYDPYLFDYTGAEDTVEWAYEEILPGDSGIGSGAGAGNAYEFSLMREMLMGVNLADTFTIGFDIQQSWNSVGVLPNTAISDDNANGSVEMLVVNVAK